MPFLKLKCTKLDFVCGSAPDPARGAHSAPPDPVAGFFEVVLLRERRGEDREGEGGDKREREKRDKLGKGGEGKGDEPLNCNFWLRH